MSGMKFTAESAIEIARAKRFTHRLAARNPKEHSIPPRTSNPSSLELLSMKGYTVYAYNFRGFVVVNLRNKKASAMWSSKWNSFLCMLASLYYRLLGKRAVKYLLAFKVL